LANVEIKPVDLDESMIRAIDSFPWVRQRSEVHSNPAA
jgi:hypothetical protein